MFMTCVVYMSCRSGVEEDMQQSGDEDFDLPPPTLVHTPHPPCHQVVLTLLMKSLI